MASQPVDHESLLANGAQHILQAYGTGHDAAGRDMMVFVIDLHDPSGRAFAERCISNPTGLGHARLHFFLNAAEGRN